MLKARARSGVIRVWDKGMRSSGFGNSLEDEDEERSQFDDSTSFITNQEEQERNGVSF